MRKGDKNCIAIFGAGGQLGRCIKEVVRSSYGTCDFSFIHHDMVDISDQEQVEKFFCENAQFISAVINCAAFTNVNDAEFCTIETMGTNAHGVRNLARMCAEFRIPITHISTNYVFSGTQMNPYREDDLPLPLNKYGESKLKGEEALMEECSDYIIIRTGWLYSPYGENFYTKIKKKLEGNDRLELPVNHIGTPTSAYDLADFAILVTLNNLNRKLEDRVINFTNTGVCSWYDFAKTIAFFSGSLKSIHPVVKTELGEFEAARPQNSTLDMTKTNKYLEGHVKHWMESLLQVMRHDGTLDVPQFLIR